MKIKLVCDVDIDFTINELFSYLIKIGYIEVSSNNKNIRRFKKDYEDDLSLYINIPSNENLTDYDLSINRALNLICINEDKSLPLVIKEIKNRELNEYNHYILATELIY